MRKSSLGSLNIDANQWGLDQGTTGFIETGNTTTPAVATFTYVYNTGAWTFSDQ